MILFGQQFARGVLCDPISAITGAVGVGTSLLGGILGSHAANSAATIQQNAANAANKQVTDAAAAANPGITAAAQAAGQGATNAAGAAGTAATGAAQTAGANAVGAGQLAAQGVTDASKQANNLLNPYTTAGSTAAGVLNTGIAAGGDFNKTPTLQDLQIDPGYAFRSQQAQEALSRGAAAHGATGSGGFAKDLNDYVQGSASQEYQNAFNRFETSTQNRFANVSGVANAGQAAAGTQGANITGAARYAGDVGVGTSEYQGTGNTNAAEYAGSLGTSAAEYAGSQGTQAANLVASNSINAANAGANYLTQGANAAAAGKVGAANAWSGALSGVGSAVGGAVQNHNFSNLINNPYSVTPSVVFSNGAPLNVSGARAATGVL